MLPRTSANTSANHHINYVKCSLNKESSNQFYMLVIHSCWRSCVFNYCVRVNNLHDTSDPILSVRSKDNMFLSIYNYTHCGVQCSNSDRADILGCEMLNIMFGGFHTSSLPRLLKRDKDLPEAQPPLPRFAAPTIGFATFRPLFLNELCLWWQPVMGRSSDIYNPIINI